MASVATLRLRLRLRQSCHCHCDSNMSQILANPKKKEKVPWHLWLCCDCDCDKAATATVTQTCLKYWLTSRKRRKSLGIWGCALQLRQCCDCGYAVTATQCRTMTKIFQTMSQILKSLENCILLLRSVPKKKAKWALQIGSCAATMTQKWVICCTMTFIMIWMQLMRSLMRFDTHDQLHPHSKWFPWGSMIFSYLGWKTNITLVDIHTWTLWVSR